MRLDAGIDHDAFHGAQMQAGAFQPVGLHLHAQAPHQTVAGRLPTRPRLADERWQIAAGLLPGLLRHTQGR